MKSDLIYEEAKKYMAGGVSAGGRYHPTLGKPLILESADGCIITDVDGREWIDYHSCSGSVLLGFNHPEIRAALEKSISMGFFINNESAFHLDLAKQISGMVPSAEKVRLANSGTEATLGALRLARAYTGKKKIIKFEGHFHGMHEFVFYNWHNRLGDLKTDGEIEKVWDTGGMVEETDNLIIIIPFNDEKVLDQTVEKHKDELAAVICEPVMYNAGCIMPRPEYLAHLRKITKEHGILLIFDEVLSGFRMHKGGGQAYFGVIPDLTTLGKVLGCGMTIAALAGKAEVMDYLSPAGKVVMSGTYTGPLMGVMGALAALKVIDQPGFYEELNSRADYFYSHINDLFQKTGLRGVVQGLGARFGLYFGLDKQTDNYREAAEKYDRKAAKRFFELVMDKGLYFHNYGDGLTPMHSGITSAHSYQILDETLNRLEDVFSVMAKEKR